MMLDHLYCPISNKTCSVVITTIALNQEAAKLKEYRIPSVGFDSAHEVMPNCNSNNTYLQHTCIIANTDINMAQIKHSKNNFDKKHDIDNNSHRLLHDEICDTKNYSARSDSIENERYEMHNKIEYKYGKEWITRKRKELVYNSSRRAGNLKLKCVRDAREWTEAFGNTISVRVRALAVAGLLLAMLSTCAAEPRDRPTRSIQLEKSARSYLEKFGYLNKGGPEVGNLKAWSEEQFYEDDFKIAIKNLQEFAGIPVTGELDDETLKLMKRRRCGRPDVESSKDETNTRRRKRFAIQGDKWVHTNLTWSLSSVSRPSQLDPYGTRAVLARALDVWAQASRLTFQEINSDEADIVVSFARGFHDDAYPFDGRGSILAHAFFPGTGRGGDAHFDDDELWLLQPKNDEEEGTSLLAVAAHEFGHSLGLSHSSVVGALMYPYYQGIQPNFVLPEDDRNGIQQLYGPKEKRTWAKIPYHRPVETPPPTTTTTTTTTTTKRIYIHHRTIRPDRRYNYSPYHPRVNHYPAHRPNRPGYTDGPSSPERPYHPRHHDTSDEHPRRNGHHTHTTEPTTYTPYRPRYPSVQPDYPKSNYPTNPRPNYPKYDYPKKKPYIPVKTTTERVAVNTPSDKPDTCDTSYDAVALIRGELFIFKDKYHWRIGANGRYSNYPLEIVKMWTDLPKDLTHVDAVYERPDRNIAFFIGKQLYLFDSRELIRGYPKSLAELGLPDDLEKIDAAMVWGHNGKTYFYSGNLYWKYDESEGRVELDYPRDMIMWKGVGYNIDSVFQWKDGKTYFFKGKGYWKFNDLQMRVENERQHPSAPFWMGCPTKRTDSRLPAHSPPAPESTIRSPSSASVTKVFTLLPFFYSIIMVSANYLRYCS